MHKVLKIIIRTIISIKKPIAIIGLLIITATLGHTPSASAKNNDFIPINKGNYWLYRITTESGLPVAKTNELFKVEVLDYIQINKNLQITLLSGFPGMTKEKCTLIIESNKNYYLVRGEEDFNKAKKSKDNTDGLYNRADPILILPLTLGQKFSCDSPESMARRDNYYCNWVKSIKPANSKYFPNKKQYQISFYTLPDSTNYYYVNGVGVTYFTYSHNGSLDEEKWNLIKYYITK